MNCPKCGNEIIPGERFCEKCGSPIENKKTTNFCMECGTKCEDGEAFCSNCGLPLTDLQGNVITNPDDIKEQDLYAMSTPDPYIMNQPPQYGEIPQYIPQQQQEPQNFQQAPQGVPTAYQQQQAPQAPKKKGKGALIGGLVAGLVIVLLASGWILYGKEWWDQRNVDKNPQTAEEGKKDSDDDDSQDTPENTAGESIDPSAEPEATEAPIQTPVPTKEVVVTEAPPVDEGIHRYEYIRDDCSWTQALQKAKEAGGYLARINTREEYDYILSEIAAQNYGDKPPQFRIGGRRDPAGQDYFWVDENNQFLEDEKPLNGANYWAKNEWMTGEPSYRDGDLEEEYMVIHFFKTENRWTWNDVPDDVVGLFPENAGRMGFIIEYDN